MPCPNFSHAPIPPGPFPPSELITTEEAIRSQDTISSTEKSVLQIQAIVDDPARQEVELPGPIRTHRAAISPLNGFPSELLAKIFVECTYMENHLIMARTCPPMMLMWVCSRWREIVLNTPQLWTKLVKIPLIVDFWITQSKELPLQFRLALFQDNHCSALKALIPHAHRWERVHFHLQDDSNSVLAPVRDHLHSLKRLGLSFAHAIGTVDFCEVAPQLTEIRLQELYRPIVIKLPWKQLQVCTLDNLRVAHHVLQHAENLRTCYLDAMLPPASPWLSMPHGRHSHHLQLSTLTIVAVYFDMGEFFSSTSFPSLQTLKVDFAYRDYGPNPFEHDPDSGWNDGSKLAPIMFRFMERSSAQLRALTLTQIPFSENALIECLALVPSLVSLDIGYRGPQNVIEDRLLGTLDVNLPGYILPRLSSLAFRGPGRVSEESLDAFITSRRDINPANNEVALLENLTLRCPVPQRRSSHRPPSFHRFVSEGLNIECGENWQSYNSGSTGRYYLE